MAEFEPLTLEAAEALMQSALEAQGASAVVAASVAQALVAAEAEGQAGHGFSRLEDYAAQLRSGKINGAAQIAVSRPAPAQVWVDADHGFAYPALEAARAEGVAVAAEMGMASMAVSRSHHCGALSVQVAALAEAGFIGLMVANTPSAIAPWGAREPLFGTNPIAFAVPRRDAAPLVIDLSLSVVARGKIMNAKKTGGEIPEGWALDADGQPTTDPDAALAGSMVPIGDAKGTALALMVEVLAAVLTESTLSADATSFFAAEGDPPGVGQFLLAIKPRDGAGFAARLERLLERIADCDGARLPGMRREAAVPTARERGLQVPRAYAEVARRLAAG